jgi:hypothetical protein
MPWSGEDMLEKNRDEYQDSSFSFRTVIQIVAMGTGILLIFVGLAMAYGVFRAVHDTLLSPENFVRIVDAWAEPIRDRSDEIEVDSLVPGPGQAPTPRAPLEPSEAVPLAEAPRAPPMGDGEEIPDRERDAVRKDDTQEDDTQDDVDEAREEGENPIVEESAAEPVVGNDIVEDSDARDEAAPELPPLQDNAIPLNEEIPPMDRSFFTVLDKFLDAIREQDLGRAAGGFLVFLFLLVLVKIPLAILTVGGNILSSVVKSSQVNVWRYKSRGTSTKRTSRHDNESPLNVGDLH